MLTRNLSHGGAFHDFLNRNQHRLNDIHRRAWVSMVSHSMAWFTPNVYALIEFSCSKAHQYYLQQHLRYYCSNRSSRQEAPHQGARATAIDCLMRLMNTTPSTGCSVGRCRLDPERQTTQITHHSQITRRSQLRTRCFQYSRCRDHLLLIITQNNIH